MLVYRQPQGNSRPEASEAAVRGTQPSKVHERCSKISPQNRSCEHENVHNSTKHREQAPKSDGAANLGLCPTLLSTLGCNVFLCMHFRRKPTLKRLFCSFESMQQSFRAPTNNQQQQRATRSTPFQQQLNMMVQRTSSNSDSHRSWSSSAAANARALVVPFTFALITGAALLLLWPNGSRTASGQTLVNPQLLLVSAAEGKPEVQTQPPRHLLANRHHRDLLQQSNLIRSNFVATSRISSTPFVTDFANRLVTSLNKLYQPQPPNLHQRKPQVVQQQQQQQQQQQAEEDEEDQPPPQQQAAGDYTVSSSSSASSTPAAEQRMNSQQQQSQSSPDPEYRIIGGVNAPPSMFKWFCSMRSAANNAHFCGCSLIAPNLILTAAHCLAQQMQQKAPHPAVEVGR